MHLFRNILCGQTPNRLIDRPNGQRPQPTNLPHTVSDPIANSGVIQPSDGRRPRGAPLTQEARELLDLAHDAIIVRSLDGTVLFWSRGAAEQYGHQPAAAVGRRKQELLHTEFPCSLKDIESELSRKGRWDGELTHTCHDGRRILVESRWALNPRTEESGAWVIEINRDISVRRDAELAVRKAHANLLLLSRRLVQIQETERRKISRELHDEVGQDITAVRLNLLSLPAEDPASQQLRQESLELLERLLEKVRSVAFRLRPSELDDLGLIAALRSTLNRSGTRVGFNTEFHSNLSDDFSIPPDRADACFRIVQEALTNIARHAAATRVVVRLDSCQGALRLSILDNGLGFNPSSATAAQSEHLGLTGMEERARIANGTFQIRSSLGQGTEILLTFPPEDGVTSSKPG